MDCAFSCICARLKGEEKERARLGYAADDLGFVGDPYQEARQRYISNALEAWRNNEANKPKSRGGKSETEKAEDSFSRLLKQHHADITPFRHLHRFMTKP
jgi:phage-related minor tail protein